jgi:hypothetical protein
MVKTKSKKKSTSLNEFLEEIKEYVSEGAKNLSTMSMI